MIRGERLAGLRTKPVKVLYFSEEGLQTFKHKAAFNRFDEEVLIFPKHEFAGWTWPQILAFAFEEASEWGADLIVFDTLSRWAGFTENQENDQGAVTAVLDPLLDRARKEERAVLLVHHSTKLTGDPRGSTAIMGHPDIVATLRKDSRNESLRVLHSVGRFETSNMTLRLERSHGVYSVVSGGDSGLDSLDQEILDLCRITQLPIKELADQLSENVRTVRDRTRKIEDAGILRRTEERPYRLFAVNKEAS